LWVARLGSCDPQEVKEALGDLQGLKEALKLLRELVQAYRLGAELEESIKMHYELSVLAPARVVVRRHKPATGRHSKLKYNIRHWVKKYYGRPWLSILVTKHINRLLLSVAVVGDVYVVFDVNTDFLPFPPLESTVRAMLHAAFTKLQEICVKNKCREIRVDPELPLDLKRYGIEDIIKPTPLDKLYMGSSLMTPSSTEP
jgi:hypothetical protein